LHSVLRGDEYRKRLPSTPPFSLEQPGGFAASDKAGFYHNTFDPFYRDQEGAVPEGDSHRLRDWII